MMWFTLFIILHIYILLCCLNFLYNCIFEFSFTVTLHVVRTLSARCEVDFCYRLLSHSNLQGSAFAVNVYWKMCLLCFELAETINPVTCSKLINLGIRTAHIVSLSAFLIERTILLWLKSVIHSCCEMADFSRMCMIHLLCTNAKDIVLFQLKSKWNTISQEFL